MTIFQDLSEKGAVYKAFASTQSIRSPFDHKIIDELADWSWYEELFDKYGDSTQFILWATQIPVYVLHLNQCDTKAMQILVTSYPPLSAFTQKGHFFDFLIINTELQIVWGCGLGRKNRIFSLVSKAGAAFDQDAAVEEQLRSSMPWDFLSKLSDVLKDLSRYFDEQLEIPASEEVLIATLNSEPTANGTYFLDDGDNLTEISKEDLEDFLDHCAIIEEGIDDIRSQLTTLFPKLDVYELNTGDY